AVQLVRNLAIERGGELLRLRHLDERRLRGRADGGARDGPSPLAEAFRVRHADLQQPVVRARVVERLDPAEQRSEVPEQDATCRALVPQLVVDLDLRLEGFCAEV